MIKKKKTWRSSLFHLAFSSVFSATHSRTNREHISRADRRRQILKELPVARFLRRRPCKHFRGPLHPAWCLRSTERCITLRHVRMRGNALCLAYGRGAACLFFSLRRFFAGYGGGVFLRRGFRVFSVGVAVLVVVQLSDGRFCADSVPFARLSLGRVKGFAPARS